MAKPSGCQHKMSAVCFTLLETLILTGLNRVPPTTRSKSNSRSLRYYILVTSLSGEKQYKGVYSWRLRGCLRPSSCRGSPRHCIPLIAQAVEVQAAITVEVAKHIAKAWISTRKGATHTFLEAHVHTRVRVQHGGGRCRRRDWPWNCGDCRDDCCSSCTLRCTRSSFDQDQCTQCL